MEVKTYRDLIAWQKAMDLTVNLYQDTEAFPQSETFGLRQQVCRAAVSIPSNIAEGQGRGTTKDFLNFLCIARGSLQELETQAILARRLHMLSDHAQNILLERSAEVTRLLGGLMRSLNFSNP